MVKKSVSIKNGMNSLRNRLDQNEHELKDLQSKIKTGSTIHKTALRKEIAKLKIYNKDLGAALNICENSQRKSTKKPSNLNFSAHITNHKTNTSKIVTFAIKPSLKKEKSINVSRTIIDSNTGKLKNTPFHININRLTPNINGNYSKINPGQGEDKGPSSDSVIVDNIIDPETGEISNVTVIEFGEGTTIIGDTVTVGNIIDPSTGEVSNTVTVIQFGEGTTITGDEPYEEPALESPLLSPLDFVDGFPNSATEFIEFLGGFIFGLIVDTVVDQVNTDTSSTDTSSTDTSSTDTSSTDTSSTDTSSTDTSSDE